MELDPRKTYSLEDAVNFLTQSPGPGNNVNDVRAVEIEVCNDDQDDEGCLYQPVVDDGDDNDLNLFHGDHIKDVCNDAELMVEGVNKIFFESSKISKC